MSFLYNAERARAAVLWLLVSALIGAAVVLSAVRVFLVALPGFSDDIEALLSKRLGVPLEIAQLDASFSGLRPALTLTGVQAAAASPRLEIARLTVSLAPWNSLRAGEIRFHALTAQGLAVQVQRDVAGRWSIVGLPQRVVEARLQGLPVDRLLLTDSQISLQDEVLGIEQSFDDVALRWRQQSDGEWRFALDGRNGAQRVQAVLAMTIDESLNSGVMGRALVRFEQVELAQARVDGQAWLTLDRGGVRTATAKIAAEQLGLLAGGVESASATLRWVRQQTGWQAAIWPERVQGLDGTTHGVGPVVLGQLEPGAPLLGRIEQGTAGLLSQAVSERVDEPVFLSGELKNVEWAYADADSWRVNAQLDITEARFADAQASVNGRLELASNIAASRVDLSANVSDVAIATIREYLPSYLVDKQLMTWLNQALVDGTLSSGSLRLAGELRDFPFDQDEGEFNLTLQAEAMVFRFNPAWPEFVGSNAALTFSGRQLAITASDGQIGEVDLQAATATVPDLWQPRLSIELTLKGSAESMLDVVRVSPLLPNAKWLDQVTLSGQPALDLALFFPFQRQPPEINGALRLSSAGLALEQPALEVQDIAGVLRFDQDGLAWDALTGQLNGAQITSTAETQGQGAESLIQIQSEGELGLDQLPGIERLPAFSEGIALWQAVWTLPGFATAAAQNPEVLRLQIDSTLEGIALDLPFGFSKQAADAAPTRYLLQLHRSGEQSVALQHGEQLAALVERGQQGQRYAAVRLGPSSNAQSLSVPESPGTVVTGQLPVGELSHLGRLSATNDSATAPGFLPAPLRLAKVDVAGLHVGRWRLGEFTVEAEGHADDWFAEGTGAVSGSIRQRRVDEQVTLIGRMEEVVVHAAVPEARAITQAPHATDLKTILPNVDLTVDALKMGESDLGQMTLTLQTDAQGSQGQFMLRGPLHQLTASLHEAMQDEEKMTSEVELVLTTENAGELLLQTGFGPVLRRGDGRAEASLYWAGRLWRTELASLSGEMLVDLRNGSLPAVEPGPGRAIGLFSVSILPRRLGLDFSDVVGSGLRFDTLVGDWSINNGIMQTQQFQIGGPALDLTLQGTNDLVRRLYDQQVVIIPRFSSTFALIGGLAGGPAAAALLFLTQGLIEPSVARLTRIEYTIQGPWIAPEFELLDTEEGLETNDQD